MCDLSRSSGLVILRRRVNVCSTYRADGLILVLNPVQHRARNVLPDSERQERYQRRRSPELSTARSLCFRLPTEKLFGNLECHKKSDRESQRVHARLSPRNGIRGGGLEARGKVRCWNKKGHALNPVRQTG